MRTLELDEIKQKQLQILDCFASLYEKYQLTWQLAYGSLIGAIRHNGYIPWDDDIDIMMPYNDYCRLCEIINTKGSNGIVDKTYRFADTRIKSTIPYHQPFMKVYDITTRATQTSLRKGLHFQEGVFIDIFFYNGLPTDTQSHQTFFDAIEACNNQLFYAVRQPQLWEFRPRNHVVLQALKGYAQSLIRPYTVYLKRFKQLIDKLPDEKDAQIAYDIKGRCMMPSCEMKNNPWLPCILWEFEGRMLPVPERYDEILTHIYGDYMTPPPREAQIPSHESAYISISDD